MAMKKNKQLANRVPKKGMTITKSLGRYQRVGGKETRQSRQLQQQPKQPQHFIVVLPRMVTLAPAVTGSDRNDFVETLQL
jgi:hypothetical protein